MKLFGDEKAFAIQFRPHEPLPNGSVFAYCHLIFEGRFIGYVDETCMLGTWILMMEGWYHDLINGKGLLNNPLFKGLNDREIFELVLKSNQLEEDFDPAYNHLPPQDTNQLWQDHCIELDETVDAYLIVMVEDLDKLKLLWKHWRGDEPNVLHSLIVDYDSVLSTIEECLDFLFATYPQFPRHQPRVRFNSHQLDYISPFTGPLFKQLTFNKLPKTMTNDQTPQSSREARESQDESLNTGSVQPQQHQKEGEAQSTMSSGGGSALAAAAVGRSATDAASHHSGGGLANTGTNISYEGATAPGAGGSAGTGEASGQAATGARIVAHDEDDLGQVGKPGDKAEGNDIVTDGGH